VRTFNGLQIFTEQLTNSGQLDARYIRITGNQNVQNLKTFNDGLVLSKNNSVTTPTASTPVSSPVGVTGQMIFSSPNIYICTEVDQSNNLYTWKRLMIQDFP
jgi:hypothetical protein